MEFWTFFQQNMEVIISLLVALIAAVKLTRWGQANAEALDILVSTIERLGLKEAKSVVASQEGFLSGGAKAAIEHAVSKADAKKRIKPFWVRLGAEIVRDLIPRR